MKEAEDGELIQKGTAYIAPGGYHLKVKRVGECIAIVLDQSELREWTSSICRCHVSNQYSEMDD